MAPQMPLGVERLGVIANQRRRMTSWVALSAESVSIVSHSRHSLRPYEEFS